LLPPPSFSSPLFPLHLIHVLEKKTNLFALIKTVRIIRKSLEGKAEESSGHAVHG
jgi:hypothetical protein